MKLNIKNGIIQDNNILGATFKRDITPFVTKKHRPGTKGKKSSVTIHNADNTSKTADAQAHANLLKNMERQWPNHSMSKSQVSWHFVVDDKQIVQCIPIDEVAYCQGHVPGNATSISIEICDNQYNYDRNKYLKAEENAAKLAGSLLETLGLSSVLMHYDWTRKNCPSKIRKEGRWNSYKSKVLGYKGATSGLGSNIGGNANTGDDEVDYSKRAVISYINKADLEYIKPLIMFLEGDYIIDIVDGTKGHEMSGYKNSNWRIAIGGTKGNHSGYMNYHIGGANREETKNNVLDFRNNADHRKNYKI